MTDAPAMFPPTLREVMLRPRWIGMLLFCLLVAGVFAWLGQWQLARAIDTDPPAEGATEVVRPIAEVVEPGQYVPEPLVGQKVSVTGDFIADDFHVVCSARQDFAFLTRCQAADHADSLGRADIQHRHDVRTP